MTTSAVLRAVTSTGDNWEDPSEDLLFMLCEDLADEGGGWFRLTRLDAPGESLEVRLDDGVFRLRREDAPGPRTGEAADLRQAHAVCTRWAFLLTEAHVVEAMWGGYDGTLAWEPAT